MDESYHKQSSDRTTINGSRLFEVSQDRILELINSGLRDSQIVEVLWSIKPSRSEDYQQAINTVKAVRAKSQAE